jgi:GntR family transcriptional regulator
MKIKQADPGHRSSRLRGPLPVHMQISEMLIRDVASGRLADGERLPPERDMAARLGIAVGTLRRALRDLTEKGLLQRVQGSGNYVQAQPEMQGVYAFFRIELIEGGGLPTADVLAVKALNKPANLPKFGASSRAYRIRRLRKLGGTPVAIEEIWLDGSRAEKLAADDLSESLYLHYRNALGFHIARADDRVGVGKVPGWAPSEFPLEPGNVAGFIERIGWANDGASAEFSRTWFDPATARYVARIR